mgnify:CR=1 FL=1
MSIGAAFTGAENRCEPTTWMMSPAVMNSFARRTFSRNVSGEVLEAAGGVVAVVDVGQAGHGHVARAALCIDRHLRAAACGCDVGEGEMWVEV